jgi:hypothetical protein
VLAPALKGSFNLNIMIAGKGKLRTFLRLYRLQAHTFYAGENFSPTFLRLNPKGASFLS